MQRTRRTGHADEVAARLGRVVHLVIETGFCGFNSMGLLALAGFARNSESLVRNPGIRRPIFCERSPAPGLRKICLPRGIKNVVAQATGSRRRVDVRFRFNGLRGHAPEGTCRWCCGARESGARPRAVDLRLRDGVIRERGRNYSLVPRCRLACAYSRFNLAIKLALISAGQTASHS